MYDSELKEIIHAKDLNLPLYLKKKKKIIIYIYI